LREAREREARVELLRRQVTRRIMNADLSRGWTAWKLLWEAVVGSRRLLTQAANRLMKPMLSNAFAFWRRDWDGALKEAEEAKRRDHEGRLLTRQQELEMALREKDGEWEAKLSIVREEHSRELEVQRIKLAGTAEEQQAYAAARDKEARIELLRRQISRRMLNADLSRGWMAWTTWYDAVTQKRLLLKQAASRIVRPVLSASFRFWLKDFEGENQRNDARRQRRELEAVEVQLSDAQFKVGQLNMVRVAHEDEITALKEKLRRTEADVRAQEAAVTDLQPKCLQQASQIANLEAELEAAQLAARDAERERDLAREQSSTQHEANEALLARLLAEQRATFEIELRELKEAHVQTLGDKTAGLEAELQRESALLLEVRQAHLDTQQQLRLESDGRSQVESELGTTREKLNVASATLEERQEEVSQLRVAADDLKVQLGEARDHVAKLEREMPKKPPPKPKTSSGVLGAIDLDEGPDAPPISEQIATALRSSSGRVLDLFREWDSDGDGEISRKEFHKAMPALGLEVPKDDVNKLFDEWGGTDGTIDYKELSRILKAKPKSKTPAKNTK